MSEYTHTYTHGWCVPGTYSDKNCCYATGQDLIRQSTKHAPISKHRPTSPSRCHRFGQHPPLHARAPPANHTEISIASIVAARVPAAAAAKGPTAHDGLETDPCLYDPRCCCCCCFQLQTRCARIMQEAGVHRCRRRSLLGTASSPRRQRQRCSEHGGPFRIREKYVPRAGMYELVVVVRFLLVVRY